MNIIYANLEPELAFWSKKIDTFLEKESLAQDQLDGGEYSEDAKAFFNCKTKEFGWQSNGAIHCDNGKPALLVFAAPYEAKWYEEGLYHRGDNQPACITKRQNIWAVRGVEHCTNGPAFVEYSENEEIVKEIFFLYGKEVSQAEFTFLIEKSNRLQIPLWLCLFHENGLIDNVSMSLLGEALHEYPRVSASWILKFTALNNDKLEQLYFREGENSLNLPFHGEPRSILEEVLAVIEFEATRTIT